MYITIIQKNDFDLGKNVTIQKVHYLLVKKIALATMIQIDLSKLTWWSFWCLSFWVFFIKKLIIFFAFIGVYIASYITFTLTTTLLSLNEKKKPLWVHHFSLVRFLTYNTSFNTLDISRILVIRLGESMQK